MILNGSVVNVAWGYTPITQPAITWQQLSSGNWAADDRTTDEDVFESAVVFKGTEGQLLTLETELNTQRENTSLVCSVGEEIFGADINYSSALDVTIIKYGEIKSLAMGVYTMPIRFRLFNPTFSGSASVSDLRLTSHKFSPNSSFSINKSFSMEGNATYLDRETDPGLFKGVFKQTTAEMKAIRRYLLTTARTASVSFPSFGVSKPFGQRMGSVPFNCNIIRWRDLGRKNFTDWELEIVFSRVL